jgi:glycosyltransferase involved in cell wall biosynthesis
MNIAALLPHVEVFGGVRRYIEAGNALIRRGHRVVLFTRAGEKPEWLEFNGEVRPFEAVSDSEFEVGLCSEYSILPQFDRLRAREKFFYFVLEGHKKEKEVARRGYHYLGCSEGLCRRIERKYEVRCLRAPGGINPEIFHPIEKTVSGSPGSGREFMILCYGRITKKRKGVRQVIKAVEGLHSRDVSFRILFFDSRVGEDRRDPRPLIRTSVPHDFYLDLPQDRMAWLHSQADLFVSAERRAGWANTAAEAMACGLPVVCTRSGSGDFAIHNKTALVVPFAHPVLLRRQVRRLIADPKLRERLASAGLQKVSRFTWDALAARLDSIFRDVLSMTNRP